MGSTALWSLAFRNFWRNRRRSFATGSAVVFGFVALVLLGAYIFRFSQGLTAATIYVNMHGHVAIRKADSLDRFASRPNRFALNADQQARAFAALEKFKDQIEMTGKFLSGSALLTDGVRSAPILVTGVEPDVYLKLMTHPQVHEWAADWFPFDASAAEPMRVDERQISITRRIAENMGRPHGMRELSAKDREVQIMGKNYFGDLGAVDAELGPTHTTGMTFAEETSVVAPLSLLQKLFETDGVEYVAVFLKKSGDTNRVVESLRRDLGADFEVFAFDDERWSPNLVGSMGFLKVMGTFFTILILGAVALAIANTVTLNLLERMREVGVLRAIGFNPAEIRASFLRESAVLCGICLPVGLFLSLAIGALVAMLRIRFQPPGAADKVPFLLIFDPATCFLITAVVVLVVLSSTLVTVQRKSRERVVNLLGETGA